MGTWIIILLFFILFRPDLLRPLLVINLVGLCLISSSGP